MSYRNPFWVCLHSWRVAGSAGIIVAGSEASGFPKVRLVDDQAGPLFKFLSNNAGNQLQLDRGAGTLEAVDRLLIPAGHNLSGRSLTFTTYTAGFGIGGVNRLNVTCTAGVQSLPFTSTTDRYHIISIPSFQAQIGEIYIGRDRTPARGPDPTWGDDFAPNVVEETLRSGNTYRIKAGERRRTFSYTFRRLEAADVALFAELLDQTSDGLHPFFFFPPDTAEPPVFVQLSGVFERKQDRTAPKSLGPSYVVTLEMLEVLA